MLKYTCGKCFNFVLFYPLLLSQPFRIPFGRPRVGLSLTRLTMTTTEHTHTHTHISLVGGDRKGGRVGASQRYTNSAHLAARRHLKFMSDPGRFSFRGTKDGGRGRTVQNENGLLLHHTTAAAVHICIGTCM